MKTIFSAAIVLFLFAATSFAQTTSNSLYAGFQDPGNAARPRVWWHWMNGNITKDGIRKDLLWMNRSGIGGFQNFDAALLTPQIVEKRLIYMTPDWKDAFHFATKLADSLKLEMAIAGSPGWSQSGGPWVPAKDGMKKLVWREVTITGGQSFSGALPQPYKTTGTFQNIPVPTSAFESTSNEHAPEYYEDIAVIAYRLPATDVSLQQSAPKITSSGGAFTLEQLTDGDLHTTNLLPSDSAKGFAWIQYEFAQPQTVKALTVVGGGVREQWGAVPAPTTRSLEVSDDGVSFRQIALLPLGGVAQQTITIPATTAKYFRVTFQNPRLSQMAEMAAMFGMNSKPPAGTDIAEIVLHPVTRINHAEEKAGFAAEYDLESFPTPSSTDAVAEGDVVDLTGRLNAEGVLNWAPPTGGNWKIVRFGYSLTGKQNHPASPEATGLEVDKLDARALKDYFENYLNQYKDATQGLMGSNGLQYMVTDSYEAEQETWTPQLAAEFQKRRGYSLTPWMPVLTGQIIKSTEASEGFLWDWRKTISELTAENYYDQLTDILARYGMKRYTESHENGRLYIVDGMDVKRKAAVPMSAAWYYTGVGSTYEMAQADIRESASVAHIYGQNLAAAESLTALGFGTSGAWSYDPQKLKPLADLEMASGLNRFVIHTSPHQPVDNKIPGLGLGPFGQWFTRHDTWAPYAKTWTDYLARSSYMLQQGAFVADVVYFYGEDNNITGLFGHKLPDMPKGYNFDFINPDALINLLSVKDGMLVTPSGMSYRLLVLDSNAKKMSLPVLRKIAQLAKDGAMISGVKPEMTPSLKDDQQEFQRLVNETWNATAANVYTEKTIGEVLSFLNIQPDFAYNKIANGPELLYVHRRISDADIYWVNSRKAEAEDFEAKFRVTGKIPKLWFPETGKTEPLSYRIANGMTTVKLHTEPNDAFFVVFQKTAAKTSVELPAMAVKELATVSGPWNVSFQKDRGAPPSAQLNELSSWTTNSDTGIKYFSGTATYTKTVTAPAAWLTKGTELWVNLGDVKNMAEVILNGKSLGVVWKTPFRINATGALKPGANKLEIKVTNLWVNRLIGDQQPDVKEKITYTTMPFYQAKSPLLPSGLLGPVTIVSVKR